MPRPHTPSRGFEKVSITVSPLSSSAGFVLVWSSSLQQDSQKNGAVLLCDSNTDRTSRAAAVNKVAGYPASDNTATRRIISWTKSDPTRRRQWAGEFCILRSGASFSNFIVLQWDLQNTNTTPHASLCKSFGWWATFIKEHQPLLDSSPHQLDHYHQSDRCSNQGSRRSLMSVRITLTTSHTTPEQDAVLAVHYKGCWATLQLAAKSSFKWRALLVTVGGTFFERTVADLFANLHVSILCLYHVSQLHISTNSTSSEFILFSVGAPSLRRLAVDNLPFPWMQTDLVHKVNNLYV
ncbi:hypothetical protein DFH07DRAFT_780489 [Mycena maculata]|uniref:Uncharacterized protein n=1 Tax=Mycena maculata TaxID=230809 RepID=A0AAD7I2S7_9AGAR|nr:hypothetical protein DFH07DRAFT_780489 [Mycena maculata]